MRLLFKVLTFIFFTAMLCYCKSTQSQPDPLDEWTILGDAEVGQVSLPWSYTDIFGSYSRPQILHLNGWLLMSKYDDGKTQYAVKTWTGTNIYYLWRIPEATGKGDYDDPYCGYTHMFIDHFGEKNYVAIKQR